MGHGSAVDIDFKKCPKMIFFKSRGLFLGPGGSGGNFFTGSIKFGNILIFLVAGPALCNIEKNGRRHDNF